MFQKRSMGGGAEVRVSPPRPLVHRCRWGLPAAAEDEFILPWTPEREGMEGWMLERGEERRRTWRRSWPPRRTPHILNGSRGSEVEGGRDGGDGMDGFGSLRMDGMKILSSTLEGKGKILRNGRLKKMKERKNGRMDGRKKKGGKGREGKGNPEVEPLAARC